MTKLERIQAIEVQLDDVTINEKAVRAAQLHGELRTIKKEIDTEGGTPEEKELLNDVSKRLLKNVFDIDAGDTVFAS